MRSLCATKFFLNRFHSAGRITSVRWCSNIFEKNNSKGNDASQTRIDGLQNKMKGWQIHEYGGVEILQFSDNIKIPTITSTNEVLVEVQSASVNPIDVAMMGKIPFFPNLIERFLFIL